LRHRIIQILEDFIIEERGYWGDTIEEYAFASSLHMYISRSIIDSIMLRLSILSPILEEYHYIIWIERGRKEREKLRKRWRKKRGEKICLNMHIEVCLSMRRPPFINIYSIWGIFPFIIIGPHHDHQHWRKRKEGVCALLGMDLRYCILDKVIQYLREHMRKRIPYCPSVFIISIIELVHSISLIRCNIIETYTTIIIYPLAHHHSIIIRKKPITWEKPYSIGLLCQLVYIPYFAGGETHIIYNNKRYWDFFCIFIHIVYI